MFPGRVERILLGGVVDVEDWAAGVDRGIVDTPKAYDHIWRACFDNKDQCALYKPQDTSADGIRLHFEQWLEGLDQNPEVYVDGVIDQVITSWQIKQYIFSPVLYLPRDVLDSTMQVFHEMMNGDFSRVAPIFTPPGAGAKCPLVDNSYNRPWNSDATTAVICGDRPDQRNFTFTDLKEVVAGFRELSPDFGDLWVRHSVPCINWPYRPADRFAGPFGTPKPDSSRVEGKPTAPILFSGSEIDPVTPLSAARKMSKLHPESVVLVMEGSGHSNLHDPSPCRKRYISQYWAKGKMPPEDLICEMDCKLFHECERLGSGQAGEDAVRGSSYFL